MNPREVAIEALVPDFQYVDDAQEHILLTIGFKASFYFWNGHTAAVREALINCFDAYDALYGDHLVWQDTESGNWSRLKTILPSAWRDEVRTLHEDDLVYRYMTSDPDRQGAGEYVIACLTNRAWMDKCCSSLQLRVPRSVALDDERRQTLTALIEYCCAQLAPFHANAGFSAVSEYQEIRWEAEKLDLATRYLLLYIDDFVIDGMNAPHGIKGVNWLTFISHDLAECLGGKAPFLAWCRRFHVEPIATANGFMIRAGQYPQIGPVGAPVPHEYVDANAALRPLRNGNFGAMGTGSIAGELRFDRCTSDLWIRRLDGDGTWPPASMIDLPAEPLGTPPTARRTFPAGAQCTVHGRYREAGFVTPPAFDHDMAPMVVLLPGDVFPFLLKLGQHGQLLGRRRVEWELIATL